MKNIRVFLGGTCNNSTWREQLKPLLVNVDYFDPVVKDWTPECQAEEIRQREICDIVLYTITKEMLGIYSIAEVVDDSNKRPEKVILCILEEGLPDFQIKSLKAVAKMVTGNNAFVSYSLEDVAEYLNSL